ncbi:MAG: hypothetical protein AB8G26_18890 [Ilumatobacter sp.]
MSASFDRVVIVDWSANSAPKRGKDSIWAAEAEVTTGAVRSVNLPTRHDAAELLAYTAVQPGRVLIGVDFSLGFPSGTAAALGLEEQSWRSMWSELARLLDDDEHNRNNRFAVAAELNERLGAEPGPFWGCPPSRAGAFLTTTKRPCAPLGEWRAVEGLLRARGHHPFSAWQLTGAGAVGSQSLLGIATLHRVVAAVAASDRSVDVWPLSTGLSVPTADAVLVEIWPTLVPLPEPPSDPWNVRVRDQVQVETLAAHLAAADLEPLFMPPVPPASLDAVVDEEGWIFGVT